MSDNFFNKTNQEFGTNGGQNQKVKLRLRLKSGEEFEAEGSLEFVLAQKEEFLNKTGNRTAPYSTQITPSEQTTAPYTQPRPIDETAPAPTFTNTNPITAEPAPTETRPEPPALTSHIITAEERLKEYNKRVPAIRWKRNQTEQKTNRKRGEITAAAEPAKTPYQIDDKIWVKVAYIDGSNVVLRRKIKDLKPNLAALITLAAAKILLGITKMPALELSKSMRLSGYLKGDDRLDRILAPEIKTGTLFFEGSKRNREYMISNTGTAKAYTAAERFFI